MNEYLCRLYALNYGYCERLLADIAEEEMLTQPADGINPPAWQLGHLALCTDYALGILGQEKKLSKEWAVNFGPGSKPLPEKRSFPNKQALWDAYSAGHQAVEQAIQGVDLKSLTDPNPIDFLAAMLPTTGDLLCHLMATHESMHLGHLSDWRRQMGRPPLF